MPSTALRIPRDVRSATVRLSTSSRGYGVLTGHFGTRPAGDLAAGLLTHFRIIRAVRGSSMSRSASPMKLKASTTVKMASPGNRPIHQMLKFWTPSDTIDPHSAVGGFARGRGTTGPTTAARRCRCPARRGRISARRCSASAPPRSCANRKTRGAGPRSRTPRYPRRRAPVPGTSARVRRPGNDDHGQDGVAQLCSQGGGDGEGQNYPGESENDIRDAHYHGVDAPRKRSRQWLREPSRSSWPRPRAGRPEGARGGRRTGPG